MDWEQLLNKERPRPSTNPSGEHRDEFERDFDRAIFSTPVKRLQSKAQVFPLEQNDAIRTRLTHSLEVSSVARGLAIAASKWLLQEGEIEKGTERQIEAIATTCGLIHDLGNPPFGHSGEDAIRSWFCKNSEKINLENSLENNDQLINDFMLFEGNAQSLRLVSKLQILADQHGLNLTFGTLSASCKYLASSHEVKKNKHTYSKPGYFASENEIMEKIRHKTGTGKARNPITFLVEAADDIVYSVADIEDGIKKKILTWIQFEELITKDNNVFDEVLNLKKNILKAGKSDISPNLPDNIHAAAFRTAAIGIMIKSVIEVFKNNYKEIMSGSYDCELVKEGSAKEIVIKLKEIGRNKIYCTKQTLKLEIMGRHIIGELMDIFYEGVKALDLSKPPRTNTFEGKIGALLSENYRRVFQLYVIDTTLPEDYHRFQLLTDYICGMTDPFAQRLHAELTNAKL